MTIRDEEMQRRERLKRMAHLLRTEVDLQLDVGADYADRLLTLHRVFEAVIDIAHAEEAEAHHAHEELEEPPLPGVTWLHASSAKGAA